MNSELMQHPEAQLLLGIRDLNYLCLSVKGISSCFLRSLALDSPAQDRLSWKAAGEEEGFSRMFPQESSASSSRSGTWDALQAFLLSL